MNEVVDFLNRRGVSDEVIERFLRDKIDCEVVTNLSDDVLKVYLPAYGDRVALFAFSRAKTAHQSGTNMECETLPSIVERVNTRLMEHKRLSECSSDRLTRKQCRNSSNRNAVKASRRIEVGWLNYDRKSGKFRQVRKQNGGGTRHLVVPVAFTMSEVLCTVLDLFFTNGTSPQGSQESFNFQMRDFCENVVENDQTVEETYNRTKVKMLRLYMTTTEKGDTEESCEDKDSELSRRQLAIPKESTADDDYLPDLDCGEQNQTMEGTSETVASTSSYDAYINLLSCGSDSDDETLQSALLASYCPEESTPKCNESSKEEMQRRLSDLVRQFTLEYFAGIDDEKCTVIVQRRNFIQSVIRAINKPGFDFHRRVKVIFSGEEAEDQGGPSREFFRVLMKAVALEMGLFEGHQDARVFTHNIELLRRNQYHLGGKLMAWSLANGGPGLSCMSSYMYDIWCGSPIINVDGAVEHVYDDTYQCLLKEVLAVQSESEMELAKAKWSDLCLASGIPNMHVIHLCDKYTVVGDLLCNYFQFRLSAELTAFSCGLGSMWSSVKANKDAWRGFFVHQKSTLSLDQLRKLYSVQWEERGSRRRASQEDTIYFFESLLQDCEDNDSGFSIKDVLAFWTGAESEPALGFPKPSVLDEWNAPGRPLTISFFDDKGRLPYASTCSLRLWLPLNVAQQEFNDLLKCSLTECVGFGKV